MGTIEDDSNVRAAQNQVNLAQSRLDGYKRDRDAAKQNGNYQNSRKSFRHANGKLGNSYDCNVWSAEEQLKRAKDSLAEAKKTAKDQLKAQNDRDKAEKRAEKSTKSSKYSSSSSSSSSSWSVPLPFSTNVSSHSSDSGSASSRQRDVADDPATRLINESKAEIRKAVVDAFKSCLEDDDKLEKYEQQLKHKYRIDDASETELMLYINELQAESSRLAKECKKYEDDDRGDFAEECKEIVDELYNRASKRYKKIRKGNQTKYTKDSYSTDKSPEAKQIKSEVQDVLKKINLNTSNSFARLIPSVIINPINWLRKKFK